MPYCHLELTKTLTVQRHLLLQALVGWDESRLGSVLHKLSETDSVLIQSPSGSEGIISHTR